MRRQAVAAASEEAAREAAQAYLDQPVPESREVVFVLG